MIHRNREEDEEGDEDAGAKMLQKERRMLQRHDDNKNKGTVTR
jgi:hypothetical protein